MESQAPETITKRDLVQRIADQTGQTKVLVRDILQRFLDEVSEELVRGNRLEFRKFGVFEVRLRPGRVAQNPKTLEKVVVPAKRVVKFKVGNVLKKRVELMRVDAETQLSSSFIVDYASAADKKAKPVRWLIVVMTSVVAVAAAFLAMLAWDTLQRAQNAA